MFHPSAKLTKIMLYMYFRNDIHALTVFTEFVQIVQIQYRYKDKKHYMQLKSDFISMLAGFYVDTCEKSRKSLICVGSGRVCT